jgi:SAM-dependent methyltransferase
LNSDYGLLAQIFRGLVRPEDVLVDVGSGRGRVLNYWLRAGHRGPIYGLEIDSDLATRCARRLAGWRNVTVRHGDAVENLPADATLLFLFNPFDSAVMRRLRDEIPRRLKHLDRVRIVYYAPTCLDVWTQDGCWRVERRLLDLRGIESFAERHRTCAYITPSALLREQHASQRPSRLAM